MIGKFRNRLKTMLARLGMYGFYRDICDNKSAFRALVCTWRYRRLANGALQKPTKEKIRVLFIVSEIAKWKEQTLYETMEASGDFYPMVGISAWNNQSEGRLTADEYVEVQKEAERFFDLLGDRCVRTVTIENGLWVYHDLKEFNPDIVFYTEQWGPCPRQAPYDVSKYALTFFLPYYVPDFGIYWIDCRQPMQLMVYGYFCLSESWAKMYQNNLRYVVHANKFVVTGHPALDSFYRNRNRRPKEGYVIYAPHFSFPHPKVGDVYLIGTFDWNGLQILEYAEAHPEIKWVFKPHPVLRRILRETGVMAEREIAEYYGRWAKIALVSMDANYQELFLESRVMITDCGSFLPEYGATGRPVIRLMCSQNKHIPPRSAKNVYDTYYQVHNLTEMYETFHLVIERREDPLREKRLKAIQSAGLTEVDASWNIVTHIKQVFGRGD